MDESQLRIPCCSALRLSLIFGILSSPVMNITNGIFAHSSRRVPRRASSGAARSKFFLKALVVCCHKPDIDHPGHTFLLKTPLIPCLLLKEYDRTIDSEELQVQSLFPI